MKGKLIAFTLFMCFAAIANAQGTTFTVSAPQRVSEGEKFAITFRLKNGEGSGLKVPNINGCTLVFGPAVSSSKSFSVVNGKTSSSSVYDYTYTFRADKAGSYTIGEATINVDGKKLTSRPLQLTVVKGDSQQSGSQRQNNSVAYDDISTQSADKPVSNNDIFVKIILSRNTAYEQEAVECTIKLYTKYSISSFFPTKQPSFDGFLIEEVNIQPSLNQVEEVNGQRYMTALLKKCIIFPQKSGKLTINSGNYDINVVQYENVNMGLFSVQNPRERKIQVSSNSATVNIIPLPTPQPEGFNGAVGKFEVSSRLIGNKFRTNDAASLIYTITGTGNIKYIKEPVIDFPSEFEQYTPKMDIKANLDGNNISGTATIEYTFVPQAEGDFVIGGDKFVYFDVNQRKYVTLTTPSYPVKVLKGNNDFSSQKKDVVKKNDDILHIVAVNGRLEHTHPFTIAQWWYWVLMLLPVVLLAVSVGVYRKKIRMSNDIVGMKVAKANKVARRRLKRARKLMETHKSEEFYEETLRALWGYLSDKLSIPVSQLSRDNVVQELEKYGVDRITCDKLINVLDDCEMARYTPSASASRLTEEYDLACEVINNVDKTRKQAEK